MNPYKEILRKFFSEYVGALRKRRGLTQEQMAEKLRITGRAYSDLERGIYCFSTVALVFLLLMLEEGEISLEAGASSFGVYSHSCRLHQERRCSVSLYAVPCA